MVWSCFVVCRGDLIPDVEAGLWLRGFSVADVERDFNERSRGPRARMERFPILMETSLNSFRSGKILLTKSESDSWIYYSHSSASS